jgi:hypothetical protein
MDVLALLDVMAVGEKIATFLGLVREKQDAIMSKKCNSSARFRSNLVNSSSIFTLSPVHRDLRLRAKA